MRDGSSRFRCDVPPDAGTCLCCSPVVAAASRRLTASLSRRGLLAGAAAATAVAMPEFASSQGAPPSPRPSRPVLFTDARLFDGGSATAKPGMQVLVEGQLIKAVDATGAAAPEGAMVVRCGGGTLMPGLIDAHWHTVLAALPLAVLATADLADVHIAAAAEAQRTLMRGFTTVRDVGGPSFALKRAIDGGMISGPRIFPSGALVSQTGGHGDFRLLRELPRTGGALGYAELGGVGAVADGVPEVLRRVREQLAQGASQIKLTGGGGVATVYDPLDSIQFNPDEIRAAVGAAADWGTYVTVHLYQPAAIRRYVEAGARCIEHGQLADEDAVRLIVDRDVWWSLQPFLASLRAGRYPNETQQRKGEEVWAGTDRAYELAIRHKAKVGWGSDILFSPEHTQDQSRMLAAMARWYTPAQALTMATRDNAALLALSGPRTPYAHRLGEIVPGAFADLLVVDGDPTADLDLFTNPEEKLAVIMKDGRFHKNRLAA